jgi:hypothetical protein
MPAYSPFQKEFAELDASELAVLRTVAEGWYVEYKREITNASSIAKSISAFANTYGGWIFYGVEEKSKAEPVAGAFPGIPRIELDAVLHRLRQAVATFVNPSPHFDVKPIFEPKEALSLAADRVSLCVKVPWSSNTPHVHKDGRIYRRVADGSEPKPENDRFILDQLWRRGDKLREQYARWVEKDPEFSKGEGERPFLRLLLVADLWRDRDLWADVSLEDFRSIMRSTDASTDAPSVTVPFETVYTSATGFIARQLYLNKPQDLGLTWEFRPDLRSEVLIPLNHHVMKSEDQFAQECSGLEHAKRFGRIVQAQGYENARIVDLNFLFSGLAGVMNIQDRLSAKAGWRGSLYAKARLLHVWRTCPFIDLDVILDEFEAHGVPMCLNSDIEVWPGSGPETFFEIPSYDNEPAEARVMFKTVAVFTLIARAFGLPGWLDLTHHREGHDYYSELFQAGMRAAEAQRRRRERSQR